LEKGEKKMDFLEGILSLGQTLFGGLIAVVMILLFGLVVGWLINRINGE
jgi:hypothetical protein